MAQLVYETTDTDFADRAIEAMRDAEIPCYRIGRGYSNQSQSPGRGFSENQVCIYIERDTDYAQANEILIKLGAVTDDPAGFLPKWLFALFAVIAVLVAFWVTSQWRLVLARPLTIVGGVRERWRALLGGPSTSPLGNHKCCA